MNPNPQTESLLRWGLFWGLIIVGLWLGQVLQTMLSPSIHSENPFADSITPLPPSRVAASVEIQDYFSRVAQHPDGYVAYVSLISGEAIYLQVERLQNGSANETILQICHDVVGIYERVAPSSDYPPPRFLAMQFPAQQVFIAYSDAMDFVNGEMSQADFEGRWQANPIRSGGR